jgi:predicted RNase H-like HicB family nuclease
MTVRYLVVIEKGKSSYGAYVPDLPGCVAVAKDPRRVQRLIREAIESHLQEMMLDGDTIPEPTSQCCYVELKVPKTNNKSRRKTRVSSG